MNSEKHRSKQGARTRYETNLLQKHRCRAHSLTEAHPGSALGLVRIMHDMTLTLMLLAR